jgi:hypothetical protein
LTYITDNKIISGRKQTMKIRIQALILALVMLLGVAAALHGPGDYGLLAVTFLYGADYAFFRPALKIYTGFAIPKRELSGAIGWVEGTTFFGIVLGAVCAAGACEIGSLHGISSVPSLALPCCMAGYGMLSAARLWPDLPVMPRVRFADLPRQWMDTHRRFHQWYATVLKFPSPPKGRSAS